MYRFAFVLLLFVSGVYAQTFSSSLEVPSLTEGPGRTASTGTTTLNFDRRIKVTVTGTGRDAEMFIYLNTVTGDLGVRIGPRGSLGSGELNINDEDFVLFRYRPDGLVMSYKTVRSSGRLRHIASSGNTDLVPYRSEPQQEAEMSRQSDVTTFFTASRSAVAYKFNSEAPTYYLDGGTLSPNLTFQKMLGYSGIGYLKTNRGIHMSVRADLGEASFIATEWRNTTSSLNLESFELAEVILQTEADQWSDRQLQKLRDRDLAGYRGECQDEQRELNRLNIADVERRKQLLELARTGNIYQSTTTQRALADMQLPALEIYNAEIDLRICRINSRPATTSGNRRLSCYRQSKNMLSIVAAEWRAIDARYPDSPGEAFMEKMSFFRENNPITGCE